MQKPSVCMCAVRAICNVVFRSWRAYFHSLAHLAHTNTMEFQLRWAPVARPSPFLWRATIATVPFEHSRTHNVRNAQFEIIFGMGDLWLQGANCIVYTLLLPKIYMIFITLSTIIYNKWHIDWWWLERTFVWVCVCAFWLVRVPRALYVNKWHSFYVYFHFIHIYACDACEHKAHAELVVHLALFNILYEYDNTFTFSLEDWSVWGWRDCLQLHDWALHCAYIESFADPASSGHHTHWYSTEFGIINKNWMSHSINYIATSN